VHTQAAYNNTSEIELEECDVISTLEPEMSLFPVGTKVAKQFEGDDQQLEWFAGAIQRFDEDDKLYWVLYCTLQSLCWAVKRIHAVSYAHSLVQSGEC
jgi:hypothetical protein